MKAEEFRKKFLQRSSSSIELRDLLQVIDALEACEQEQLITTSERERWKDEATKYGKAFKAAAKVLRAVSFTPTHLGEESSKDPKMWMSFAHGVIRAWNENRDELLELLKTTEKN